MPGTSGAAFYHCRYCCRWKVLGDFSSEQLLWADAVLPGRGRASRDGRGHRADPVCRSCAHFALSLENTSTALEEGQRSVSREVRYVLILTFCGEYEGVPEFNEDILRCILSFLTVRVAPFVSDPGDSYRCVACQRDFQSLDNVMQHLRTSKRHAQVVREALGDGRAEGSAGGYVDGTCHPARKNSEGSSQRMHEPIAC
ncbi:unnamed protein product [Cladocopium goreaui]|uniref:C2H2-type domain-containing protein n=1 Tax=Cladocopium goreaui TaxID=2562237 RepID=A0A9P1GPX0_9DINO|nr:unnamed protein product [Cladocopium goreaui]